MTIKTTPFRELITSGRLSEAFVIEGNDVSFCYLTPLSEGMPHFELSLNDAANVLHQLNQHHCEQKINTLKRNFQSLAWYKRAYYVVLQIGFWLPLLPKTHREQCLNTERQLSSLIQQMDTPVTHFKEACLAIYTPENLSASVRHRTALLPGTTLFFLDTSQLFLQRKLYYYEDSVAGWLVQKPLIDNSVDWDIHHITDHGRKFKFGLSGELQSDTPHMIFLSEDEMKKYVTETFEQVAFHAVSGIKHNT